LDAYKALLGEILIQRRCLNRAQLEDALKLQSGKENSFIGEILVKLGYLEEQDIVTALVIQQGQGYIAVNKYALDSAIVRLIPREWAQKEKVIALDRIGNILSVAMAHPLTEDKKRFLGALTKCAIATFIAAKTQIEDAIMRHY